MNNFKNNGNELLDCGVNEFDVQIGKIVRLVWFVEENIKKIQNILELRISLWKEERGKK